MRRAPSTLLTFFALSLSSSLAACAPSSTDEDVNAADQHIETGENSSRQKTKPAPEAAAAKTITCEARYENDVAKNLLGSAKTVDVILKPGAALEISFSGKPTYKVTAVRSPDGGQRADFVGGAQQNPFIGNTTNADVHYRLRVTPDASFESKGPPTDGPHIDCLPIVSADRPSGLNDFSFCVVGEPCTTTARSDSSAVCTSMRHLVNLGDPEQGSSDLGLCARDR
jgi:hypothetical protein